MNPRVVRINSDATQRSWQKTKLIGKGSFKSVKRCGVTVLGLCDGVRICSDEFRADFGEDVVLQAFAEHAAGDYSEGVEVVLQCEIAVVGGCGLQVRVALGNSKIRNGLAHEGCEIAVVRSGECP